MVCSVLRSMLKEQSVVSATIYGLTRFSYRQVHRGGFFCVLRLIAYVDVGSGGSSF